MTNLKSAQAAYLEASAALTTAHAECRALVLDDSKTIKMVKVAYDRLAVVRAAFEAARGALDAAEKAAR